MEHKIAVIAAKRRWPTRIHVVFSTGKYLSFGMIWGLRNFDWQTHGKWGDRCGCVNLNGLFLLIHLYFRHYETWRITIAQKFWQFMNLSGKYSEIPIYCSSWEISRKDFFSTDPLPNLRLLNVTKHISKYASDATKITESLSSLAHKSLRSVALHCEEIGFFRLKWTKSALTRCRN